MGVYGFRARCVSVCAWRRKERATYKLALLDQLGRIVLGDDGLEDLVGDRREDPLVVIEPEVLVDLGQVLDVWAREDPERDRDHLEVCCRGGWRTRREVDGWKM